MKPKALLLALMLWCCQSALADTSSTIITLGDTETMTLSQIIAKGLPVLTIETVNQEEPTCDYVSGPQGTMGAGIANATKVPGRLVLYRRIGGMDSVLYDSGDYEKDSTGLTIKIRGNTSAYEAKKPYKIKLQKKADLLMRGNDSIYKDKEWLLLRDDYLTTTTGLKINEMLGMPWTPAHHFVNVIMNGAYRGVYLLCESVKRNPDCRLKVDKHSGYVFELDPYWWNEDVYVSSKWAPAYNYTFKYPDSDDITEEQLAYMQRLVGAYEASITSATYTDFIDVRSFAGWCLAHDLMGTKDAGGANRFYTKYDSTPESKIVMPLAWDFDMAFRTQSAWSRSHIDHMTVFFNSPNRAFTGEFADLWRKVRRTFVSKYSSYMNNFQWTSEGSGLQASYALDKLVYGHTMSVYSYVAGHISWMETRYTWIDNAINTMNPLGDVNVDGTVNMADVTTLIDALLNDTVSRLHAADANENGAVDVGDVAVILQQLLNQ